MVEMIKTLGKKHEAAIVEFREYLHRNPELSFKEYNTTKIIKEKLTDLGIEVIDLGIETGVVGLLKGNQAGPTIALRGDIDALPIQEISDKPYKSAVDGVMHACGHDFHTAAVLGTASILSEMKDAINGNVMFIFQPAEEINKGAKLMVEKGLLRDLKADMIFGLHNNPEMEWGTIGIKKGGLMAAVDTIKIKIIGKGGHGAIPHATKDAIVAAASLVMNLQTVASRNVSPLESAVVSFGTIHAGIANNVIPEVLEMTGTVRSFNPDVQKLIYERMTKICSQTAEMFDVKVELDYMYDLPAVFNKLEMTKIAYAAATAVVGEGKVVEPIPSMGGEDFSIFANEIPGFFFWIGVGNKERDMNYVWHNPRFDGDSRALPIASMVLSNMVFKAIESLETSER